MPCRVAKGRASASRRASESRTPTGSPKVSATTRWIASASRGRIIGQLLQDGKKLAHNPLDPLLETGELLGPLKAPAPARLIQCRIVEFRHPAPLRRPL